MAPEEIMLEAGVPGCINVAGVGLSGVTDDLYDRIDYAVRDRVLRPVNVTNMASFDEILLNG